MFRLARYLVSLYNKFSNSYNGEMSIFLFDQMLLLTVINGFIILMWGQQIPIVPMITILTSCIAYLPIQLANYADRLDQKYTHTKQSKLYDGDYKKDLPF